MQVDSHALRDRAPSLAGGLRWEFEDVQVAAGDAYVPSVEGSNRSARGVIATCMTTARLSACS